MTTFDLITAGSSYLCSYCAAGVGEPCRTKTGGRATYMHAARSQPLWRVWNAGYRDALRDVANNPGWWGRVRHRYLNKETPMSTIAAVLFPHDLVDDDEYDRLTRYACCECPFEAASNLIKRQAKETPRRLEIP